MWEQIKKRGVWIVMALCVIPYLALQVSKERKTRELDAHTYTVDEQVPVKLTLDTRGSTITYLDGTALPADAHGLVCFTWDDFQKTPERLQLKGVTLTQDNFPVVVFFNASGFDSSGEPVLVRQAKEGKQLWSGNVAPRLRHAVPQRDGSFMTYPAKGEPALVKEADWYRLYMGSEPPLTPEQLAKLTEEQLQALGLGKPKPPVAPEMPPGVQGVVLRVGGNPALVPLKVPVHIFKGEVKPVAKYDPKDDRIVLSLHTDDKGQFKAALPAGVYTITIELDGRLLGNAANPEKWPTVTVKDGAWTPYEFRTR